MNRRNFIVGSALSLTSAALMPKVLANTSKAKPTKITILHTNDMHSRIDPFPEGSGKWAGLGGMARRATLIEEIRKEEEHILLLDAGDIFQGTPYFNFYGGELEYKLMSQMKYDAATFGNHDFDNGLAGIEKMLPLAKFPFLTANYDFSKTSFGNQIKPYKIFKKGGIKIGVFGLGIELKGLVPDNLYGPVVYHEPLHKAREAVSYLRKEGCSLVICLSHLGYNYEGNKVSDRVLATNVDGIDLIIGGHTHTFLEKPELVTSPSGVPVLVNQVGWAGINLGRIDFYFGKHGESMGYEPSVLPIIGLPEIAETPKG